MASEWVELESAEPEPVDQAIVDQRYHLALLIPSVAVLVLSVLLSVPDGTHVVVPVVNVTLPDVCTFKRGLGVDCPGCGLTRCFISMGHGQVVRAFRFHPVGVGFFVLVAAQLPYRILQIRRLRRGLPEWQLGWFGYWLLTSVAAALVAHWILKIVWLHWIG